MLGKVRPKRHAPPAEGLESSQRSSVRSTTPSGTQQALRSHHSSLGKGIFVVPNFLIELSLCKDLGDFCAKVGGEEPPGYITWDSQVEASFRQVEMLMEQFYALSETSPAAFGNLKAGLVESGSALRRLMMAPLAKVNRVRMGFDAGLREVLRLAALLDSGRAVEPVIGWADGLPDDESEEIRNEATAVASEVSSRRSSMKRLWGYTDEQADEELQRIRAEQPSAPEPVLGEGGPDEEEA